MTGGLFDETPLGWVIPNGYTAEITDPPARCRSCRAEILWTTTPANKRAPLNRDGTSHFATCPQAADWRRPAGAGR